MDGYVLEDPVGHGGMATVFRASALCGTRVAIKVLNPAHAGCDEARALFRDKALLATVLDHPNIARVYGAGVDYLAMEYVDGIDLRALLGAIPQVGFAAAVAIVAGAARGLDHAHRACDAAGRPVGIVHRDVSLSNLMVTRDGAVKVVDFGIASSALTRFPIEAGVVRGKAGYMAPEQCFGGEVDFRADVFGLGVVLYELCTGARCFVGESDFDKMLATVRGDFAAPSAVCVALPTALEAVILRALASTPEQRYGSAAELADALDAIAAGHGWPGRAAIAAVIAELPPGPFATSATGTSRTIVDHLDELPTRGRRPVPRSRADVATRFE